MLLGSYQIASIQRSVDTEDHDSFARYKAHVEKVDHLATISMKFAEYLKENLVPEWKEKYLDYKGGKKLIKKVAQGSSLSKTRTGTLSAATPSLPLPSSIRLGDFSFKQRKRGDSHGSFELPPAALTPRIDPRQQVLQDELPKNDKTPLLGARRERALRSETPTRTTNTPNDLRRVKSHPATYGGGSISQDGVQLDSLNDTNIREFIEWLDGQLLMIEKFYKEREDHCVTRYLQLQDQMFHLREDKARLIRKKTTMPAEPLKLGFAKTTTKFSTMNKLDLPSLPTGLFKTSKTKSNEQRMDGRRDYESHVHSVPYYVARRQLKAATQEHYRELELLKSYRMLNRTGFRKLLKKFDKRTGQSLSSNYMEKVNDSHFASSDTLDNLLPKVEDMYSANFEEGNRKVAVEKLRTNLAEDKFYTTMFLTGILFGLSIPLLAYSIYLGVHKTKSGELFAGQYLLQIWAGFLLVIFMAICFSVNCYIWARSKVNYRFIFEYNPKTALNYREVAFLPAVLLFGLAIFGWFSFNDFWPERFPARFWPWFFVGFALIVLFLPFNVLMLDSRKWLLITMWRLSLSGFYPVEFKDFLLGDIFCSLSYTMGNISFFFCIYATHWNFTGDSVCPSSRSHLMGFFSALPPIWRFMQCIRRYADSGDWFPHLANMCKYTLTIVYYLTLSVYRIDRDVPSRAAFIFFAIINSVVSSLWDVFMDWSLMQNKYLLRDDLIYPIWFYYFSIITDVILRFQWIFYALFSRQIQQSAVTSFCVAIAEILRRFIWLIIRLENEHITNIHLYRAFREAPLPYTTIERRPSSNHPEEGEETVDDDIIQTVPEDIESGGRYDAVSTNGSNKLRRRNTIINGDIFRSVTRAIVTAHAKDFQRRKPKPGDDDDNSSDEDNSDNDHDS